MNGAEKIKEAALMWLKSWADPLTPRAHITNAEQHARTLEAMLAEPRLPKEPSADALKAMQDGIYRDTGCMAFHHTVETAYRALHAHLTTPKTKTVWRVTWKTQDGDKGGVVSRDEETYGKAMECLLLMGAGDNHVIAASITKQEVPA